MAFKVTIFDEFLEPPRQPNLRWQEVRAQGERRGGMCRVCLSDDQEGDNLIICPCNCTGSCAFVHVYCLRQWLSLRLKKDGNSKALAYSLQSFSC
jgi:hypothetical protein